MVKTYGVGELVWLSARNIRTKKPSKKLMAKRFGPYLITERIGRQACKLKLPPRSRIYPVFNVSLLEPHLLREGENAEASAEDLKLEEEEEGTWEVDSILDSRILNGQLQYLVKWTDFGVTESTWEPPGNLTTCKSAVRAFHRRNPNKPGKIQRENRGTKRNNSATITEQDGLLE